MLLRMVLFFLIFSTSEEIIVRLDCKRKALFAHGETNYCCEGEVLGIRKNSTLTQCSLHCLMVNDCAIINVKRLSYKLINCQFMRGFVQEKDCKKMYSEDWEYYYVTKDNIPMDQITLSCRKGDSNRCSREDIEEKLDPMIYVPFDHSFCNTAFLYRVGRDNNGIMVPPNKDAKLQFDTLLQRLVLVKSTYTPQVIGYFTEHPLNEPYEQELSIALWIKCRPGSPEFVSFANSGRYRVSGVFIGHEIYGKRIRFAVFSMKGQWRYDDIVWTKFSANWMHVALTFSDKDSQLKLYVNGTLWGTATTKVYHSVSKMSSSLFVGKIERLSRLSFWNRVLSMEEVGKLYKEP